jgi:hypothetical protein
MEVKMSTPPGAKPKSTDRRNRSLPFLHAYIPNLVLGASALGIVVWALLNGPLWPDQKPLMNVITALLCGTVGFLWGGLMLEIIWQPAPRLRVALQAVGAAAIFTLLLVNPIYPAATQAIQAETESSPPFGLIAIVEPRDGSTVSSDPAIRGRAVYAGLHYYCLVRSTAVGGAAIQDGELVRSDTGELMGKARIGNSEVGSRQTYILTIIGSKKRLNSGPLLSTEGLIYSNHVTVRRTAPELTENMTP